MLNMAAVEACGTTGRSGRFQETDVFENKCPLKEGGAENRLEGGAIWSDRVGCHWKNGKRSWRAHVNRGDGSYSMSSAAKLLYKEPT